MSETEITSAADAAEYLTTEVINEYHSIPAVHDANRKAMFVQLNGRWFRLLLTEVRDPATVSMLDGAL